jgi:oligogalacturonide transport system ATP-binding protein
MAEVVFKNLEKVYSNGFKAVHSINLTINDGEFLVIVGPSGCAKSTSLRMLAGLENISGGEIRIGNKIVNNLAPKERGIAMVFQNYALYPHMSVEQNLAFGLKLAKVPEDEIKQRVYDAARILEIEDLMDRLPRQLSGGQAQRVAVGRAIVKKPEVFLFDEPLSNLDAKLRASMRVRISDLHRLLKKEGRSATAVYVTHDQTEAMTMGDRICVMKQGHIMQVDTPEKLYNCPTNMFVASFIGAPEMNIHPATLDRQQDSLFVTVGSQRLRLSEQKARNIAANIALHKVDNVHLGIRPEYIALATGQENDANVLNGEVVRLENMGHEFFVHFRVADNMEMIARISTEQVKEHLTGEMYQPVRFALDMNKTHVFDSQTEENISL